MAVNSAAVTLTQNASEGHNRKNDLAFSSFIKHQLEMMNITHTKRTMYMGAIAWPDAENSDANLFLS